MEICGLFEEPLICVDNTFATPCHQQPIYQYAVDIVLHSATKYISGHGDLIGGVVTARDRDFLTKIHETKVTTGSVMDPMTAYLCLRGLKTLAVRMRQHMMNALTLESLFDELGIKYTYPGFGGMISIDLESRQKAKQFIEGLKGPKLAVSLGETQTLINVPALMTHATYSDDELHQLGLGPGQIRVSVGLEDPVSLKEEFRKALEDSERKNVYF
jgi:methionine-gamma-lyase